MMTPSLATLTPRAAKSSMLVMRQLKKSLVIVRIRKTDTFKTVKEQMVSIAKDKPAPSPSAVLS
jgi:hypothetical protein